MAKKITPESVARAVAGTTITLRRAEPGRRFTKFTSGDWQKGAINVTVYIPNEAAADLASFDVTVPAQVVERVA